MLGTFRLSEDEQQQRQRDALHVSRVQRLVQVRQQAKRADAERLRAYRTRLLSSQVKVEGEIREKWEEAKDARCESLRKEKRRAFGEVGKGHGSACVAVLREKANEMHAEGVRQIREEATHKRFRSAVAVVRQERVDELKAQKEADNRRKDRSALDRKRAHEFGEKWEQEQKEVKDDGCEEAIVFGGMRGVPDFSRTRLHQGEGERGVFIKQAFGDLGDEEEGNKAETDAQEEQARWVVLKYVRCDRDWKVYMLLMVMILWVEMDGCGFVLAMFTRSWFITVAQVIFLLVEVCGAVSQDRIYSFIRTAVGEAWGINQLRLKCGGFPA